jgi:hypothetical protein
MYCPTNGRRKTLPRGHSQHDCGATRDSSDWLVSGSTVVLTRGLAATFITSHSTR